MEPDTNLKAAEESFRVLEASGKFPEAVVHPRRRTL